MRLLTVLVLLAGCSGSTTEGRPTADAVDAAPHTHTEAHHGHGDHMAEMAATRERLRQELGDAYEAPVRGLDAASAARGGELFAKHCVACHGPSGKGDGPAAAALQPPPSDLTDPVHAQYYSDAGRMHILSHGLPNTGMPAFGTVLSEAEVLDVYAYVRGLRGEASTAPHAHGDHAH